ncbi:MAG: M56 family metallopeptidase [Actinobacteria bacterium]|nr:M56 family metallopeptidase [Actinomycetota bacterium]
MAAAALGLCLVLLAGVVPARLARATWPQRAPAYALLLWQSLGLAGGVMAIETSVTVALAPAGGTHVEALRSLSSRAALPWWSLAAGLVALALLLRLLSVLVLSTVRTLRARHRNRVLVDLVATRNPLLARTSVVDHEVPLAYCLPGLRPRVVLSRGVLDLLREDEVRAVLAHEQAHVEQRHDLVVLPFLALGATFPRLPGVLVAKGEVALLIEMLADDRAVRRHPREVLARALYRVGAAQVPEGGFGATGTGDGVLLRAQRLVQPAATLGGTGRATVVLATGLVLALPVLGLLVPLAAG